MSAAASHAQAPTFPSKRDLWLSFVVWAGSAVSIGAAFVVAAERSPAWVLGWVVPLCLGGPAFMLWIFYRTGYTLTDARLVIRSGPFVVRVPLAEIESVTPSRNPLSSPACSLDRLHVRYRSSKRGVLISPEDKTGFLSALAIRCPELVRADDRLERREAR